MENILKTFVRYIIGDRVIFQCKKIEKKSQVIFSAKRLKKKVGSFFSEERLKKKQGHFLGHFQCKKMDKKIGSFFSAKRLKTTKIKKILRKLNFVLKRKEEKRNED